MDPDETLGLPPPHLLFASITYYIAPSFPPNRIEELDAVLQEYGGNRAEGGLRDDKLTTVIANSARWEGWEEVGEDSSIDVVTDKWIERSVVLGKLQLAQHFSTNPALLFSGVVGCSTSDLPPTDLEVLSAGIIALGGQWRTGLTKDVTHLFAMTPNSSKYATAMHYQETTRIKVVLPHWFDDTIRLGTGKLGTEPYEWPDVKMLKGVEGLTGGPEENKIKRNMYATAAIFTPGMAQTTPPLQQDIDFVNTATAEQLALSPVNGVNQSALALHPGEGVWGGRKIVLSRTLQLYRGRREAVQAGIERAGGVVLRFDGDEEEEETPTELPPEKGKEVEGPRYKLHMNERRRRRSEADKVDDCDVLVTRWRFGRAYVLAVRSVKTIGTLAWLFHVQSTGVLSRPLDQLLHYPVPKRPIEAFHNHVVTVTNYTGEAREYLKKLISAMGATFTPSMSGQNTALIAAYTSGTKATKARSWSIPVVNHTWLEDCFVQWRNLTPALEKYIVFPDGVDFATMLGERGVFVGPVGGGKKTKANDEDDERFEISKGRIELEAEELFTDGEVEVASDAEDDEDVQMAPPPASEGMANGVEEAEVLEELGMDVDVGDVEGSSAPVKAATTPAKRASPTKPAPKSQSTPTAKPKPALKSKPTPKPTKVVEDVIELESSSSEGEAKAVEQVKATGKEKTKAKVIEEEEEEEEPPTKKPRPKPKPKPTTKPTKPKPKPASEPEEDEEQDERPSKTPKSKAKPSGPPFKKRLPISSVESGDESVAEPQEEEEEPPKKGPTKKLKRRFSVASVPDNDDDEGEDEVEVDEEAPKTKSKTKSTAKPTKSAKRQPIPPPAFSSENEEESVVVVSKPKNKPANSSPSKAPSAPTKPTPKFTKATKRQPIPPPASSSDSEEESVVVISKTKTNAKPKASSSKLASGSANAADAAAGGLLNRVRGDARTRVKKRVSKGGEKVKAKEVESEDEKEDEEDEAPQGKAKAKVKAKDVRGTKGKKAVTPPESEEEDEEEGKGDDEEESEPPKPIRVSSSKSKPGVASTSKANAKAATTLTRKKPLRVYSENDEDESENSDSKADQNKNDEAGEDDEDFPSTHVAFSKAAAKSSATKKAAATQVTSTTKSKSKSKGVEPPSTKSKFKSKSTKPPATESASSTEADAPPPPTKKSTKVKDGKKTTAPIGSPSTPRRVISVLMPTLSISGGRVLGVDHGEEKAKGKGKKRAVVEKENDQEEDGEEEDEVTMKGKGKARAKAPAESAMKNKTQTKSKPTSTTKVDSKSKSKRTHVSSDEPADDQDEEEEEEEVNILVSPRTRAMARTDSLRVVSAQVNIPIPSASAAAAAGKSSSKAKGKTKATPKVAQEKEKAATVQHRYRHRPPSPSSVERDTPMDIDSHPIASASISASTSSGQSTSTLPRRSAAAKATQKLHDSIMPDVMQYEAQMKRSRSTKGRGSIAAAFVVEGDGGREKKDKERENEKRKHDEDDERSKKKRRVSFSEGVEEAAEMEALSKSKGSKGKQRAGGVPMDVDKEDPNSSTKVRVMTTQVSLADDVSKALMKLGVMFTTRPSECTHLLAQGVVRTEKFLCALAMQSYILSEKWAIASANAKRLLPEEDFPLKDDVGEGKYNVDLARALRLSKKNQGKLLQGHTFYVTPRVSIDTKLLKNVVSACGGQVTTQSPTLRIINASPETRHVISCKEDISIWRPLAAHGIKVYTQELVLEGALRQEMDWDNQSFLVKV